VNTAANLLFGYRPVWDPQTAATTPFFVPPVAAMAPVESTRQAATYPDWDTGPPSNTVRG
jgi:hypothetical protein